MKTMKPSRATLTWDMKLCLLIILGYVALALLAALGLIATDFSSTNLDLSYQAPSGEHWLGTDFLGRDVLSRAIHGARIALFIGFFAATIATLIGFTLGSLAGYFGGWVDSLVTWAYSTVESIPYILLISAFTYSLGAGLTNLYLALGLTGWVKLCRLIRGEVLKIREQEFISAAKAMGTGHLSIMFKHIAPNVLYLALVQFSLTLIFAIKIEVILSFLGLGVEPGTPSWGLMINDAKVELTRGIWWNLLAATAFMFVLVLAVNIFTDRLRHNLEPKS